MTKALQILDRIVDVVLAYNPSAKKKAVPTKTKKSGKPKKKPKR